MAKTAPKTVRRKNLHQRIRVNIQGTSTAPRMNVYRSNKEIYVQLIDDLKGETIISASSRQKDIASQTGNKSEIAQLVGKAIALKAKEIGIESVVFDRGGYLYHGRVKSLAEGARAEGLKF